MKKFIILIVLLFTGCIRVEQPSRVHCFQVDYLQDGELRHIFLNVRELCPNHYRVTRQEYHEVKPNFILLNIFDYGRN